jgi:hypothetical protein
MDGGAGVALKAIKLVIVGHIGCTFQTLVWNDSDHFIYMHKMHPGQGIAQNNSNVLRHNPKTLFCMLSTVPRTHIQIRHVHEQRAISRRITYATQISKQAR